LSIGFYAEFLQHEYCFFQQWCYINKCYSTTFLLITLYQQCLTITAMIKLCLRGRHRPAQNALYRNIKESGKWSWICIWNQTNNKILPLVDGHPLPCQVWSTSVKHSCVTSQTDGHNSCSVSMQVKSVQYEIWQPLHDLVWPSSNSKPTGLFIKWLTETAHFHVAIWAKIHQVNYKNTFTVTTMSTNDYRYNYLSHKSTLRKIKEHRKTLTSRRQCCLTYHVLLHSQINKLLHFSNTIVTFILLG